MSEKIAITTSSFSKVADKPLELIKESGFQYCHNSFGRTLNKDETIELVSSCTGIIAGTEKYDAETLNELPNLKVISRCGVGVDGIDLDEAKKRGIQVFRTPDGPTKAVAELVIGLAINLLRNISLGDRQIREGQWNKQMGSLFSGKTVGIIGFGRIGQSVGELSKALGANVLYYDPFVEDAGSPDYQRCELDELLGNAEIVTLHLPYSTENKHFLGENEIKAMRQGSYFINCSRGGIVDESFLQAALENGQIAGAAIDVFEQEPYQGSLRSLDNVILTPHIGSYAKEARINMEVDAVLNLLKGLKGV